MHGEKARWELHKNAVCWFEQILEAAPHKTAAARPRISNLRIHPSKTNKTWRTLLEKQGQTHTSMDSFTRTNLPARNNLHQLCADTGCSLEDLPRTIYDRDGWREREGERRRESHGSLCCQRGLMMMWIMMMGSFFFLRMLRQIVLYFRQEVVYGLYLEIQPTGITKMFL